MREKIVIDPEFCSLISPLRTEEQEHLEANLVAEGCRDPLVIWTEKRILLDGHNRYEICGRLGLPFDVVEVDLPNREAAADWIDANQLGRRNLTPDQYALLRGRRYNRLKKQGERTDLTSGQNVQKLTTTAERLAAQHGVDEKTIRRDGQFAAAVEKVKVVDSKIESKVVAGKAPPKGLITEAAKQIVKAEKATKETASTPLLGTRKDREAATVWEKAKGDAERILNGQRGTVAQAKRAIVNEEKNADLDARAKAAPPGSDDGWEILTGDCVELLGKQLPGSVRLIFADPPYNIGVPYGDHHDDSIPQEEYLDWCQSWLDASARLLTPDGSMWVLINDEWADFYGVMLRDAGLHRRAWIKWYESFGVNCANNFNRCSRHLFYCVKNPDHFVFNPNAVNRPSDRQAKYSDKRADPGGKVWDDVWGLNPEIPRLTGTAKERLPDFPTQLPLKLLLPLVGCASEPGDLVLDPFSGSGTTGAACIQIGRRYLGFEQSPVFADLSRKRLKAAKGSMNGKVA